MSTPTRERKRRAPEGDPALFTPPSDNPKSNAPGAAEVELMRGLVDRTEIGLWLDLMNGRFRLAMRCEVCGRWLTAHKSKAAGRGPSCAARAMKR